MPEQQTRPVACAGVVCRRLDNEYVIYDPGTDRTAVMNLSAAAVLELCDGTRTDAEIVAEVARAFSIESAAACEVSRVLADLRALGFLEDS